MFNLENNKVSSSQGVSHISQLKNAIANFTNYFDSESRIAKIDTRFKLSGEHIKSILILFSSGSSVDLLQDQEDS